MTEARAWGLAAREEGGCGIGPGAVGIDLGILRSAAGRCRAPLCLARVGAPGELDTGGDRIEGPGLFRPGLPPRGSQPKRGCPSLSADLEIQTRLVFIERVIQVADMERVRGRVDQESQVTEPAAVGRPLKVVRHVIQAASAINGEVRPTAVSIRPEVTSWSPNFDTVAGL